MGISRLCQLANAVNHIKFLLPFVMSPSSSRGPVGSSILISYLSGHATLDTTIDHLVADIETAYIQAVPADNDSTIAEGLLWDLWHTILITSSTIAFPPQTGDPSLVSLMAKLKTRATPLVAEDGYEKVEDKLPYSLGPLWNNLALWSWQVREMYDDLDPTGFTDVRQKVTTREWINFNAFLAQLTVSNVSDHSFLGQSMIRLTLESEDIPRNASAAVGATSVWLILVGKKWSEEGWEVDGLMKFKIDRARMRAWKEMLVHVMVKDLELDDVVEDLAQQALEMLQLELH